MGKSHEDVFIADSRAGVYTNEDVETFLKYPVTGMMDEVMKELGDPTYMDFYKMVDEVFQAIWAAQGGRLVSCSAVDSVWGHLRDAENSLQILDEYLYKRLGAGE